MPPTPGGTRSELSRTSPAFSPKIARRSFSSGESWVSPFGVILPTRMSPGLHLGADAHDARVVEVLEGLFADVRDVAGDLFLAELGVAGDALELLDVNRGEDVVLGDALGDQDRVLEVVALPRHERDEHVLAERELAHVGRGTVGEDVARLHAARRRGRSASGCSRCSGSSAGTCRAGRCPGPRPPSPSARTTMRVASTLSTTPSRLATTHTPESRATLRFHAGADERRVACGERHGLALHVRAHERAVGVVVLEERNERRGDRHQLVRRDVHQLRSCRA